MIVSDNVFYANPSTFNDPLDAQPTLMLDVDDRKLEQIVRRLVEQRTRAEMNAAAETIKYRGHKTMSHIERHSLRRAKQTIEEIAYLATIPDEGVEDHKRFLLSLSIETELLRQYDKGIVSLAEGATCPLMWSHYGDQHQGVCIGYSVPASAEAEIHRVEYGGSRSVQVSKVAAMMDGDEGARHQVDEAVLLRKASKWRYEREWRLIGPVGLRRSPLELEEVIFGMRCEASVKFALMKVLEGRERPIKFYEIRESPGAFRLNKCVLRDDDDLFVHFPRRSLTVVELLKASSTSPSS